MLQCLPLVNVITLYYFMTAACLASNKTKQTFSEAVAIMHFLQRKSIKVIYQIRWNKVREFITFLSSRHRAITHRGPKQ